MSKQEDRMTVKGVKAVNQSFTARELGEQYGVSVDTIQRHGVKLFGAGEVGKTRRYTGVEATAILKSIQTPVASGTHSVTSALSAEVETQLSLYMEASRLERQSKEVWRRIAEQEKTRADTVEMERDLERQSHYQTKRLLAEQMTGTAMYQRNTKRGKR